MQGTTPAGGGGGLGQAAAMAAGAPPKPDITVKVMEVEPVLTAIARQVPALAPDVDRMLGEFKSRMGGSQLTPPGLAAEPTAAPSAAPPQGGVPPGPAEGMPAGPAGTPPPPGQPGAGPLPAPPPETSATMGLMDLSLQAEIALPSIAADDPTLAQTVTFFIARLREEVPKVLQGTSMSTDMPPASDEMINEKLPTLQ